MATHSSILAGRIHGQRSLAGYSPWSYQESDTTKQLRNNKTQHIHFPDQMNTGLIQRSIRRQQTTGVKFTSGGSVAV